jgi:hypothetical protein
LSRSLSPDDILGFLVLPVLGELVLADKWNSI